MENEIIIHRLLIKENSPDVYRICEGKTPGEIKDMESQEEGAVKRAEKAINVIKKAESITLPLEERINLARSLTGRKPRTDGSGGVR